MSIHPLDYPHFTDFEYRFELTSAAFNSRLNAIELATESIVGKINEIVTATEDVFPATAISYDAAGGVSWLNVTNVAAAITALALKYGNHDLLFDSGAVQRDHRQINHTGIQGIPNIDQSKYEQLVSGNNTLLHRHDQMYYTKTQLAEMGIASDTKRLVEIGSQENLAISNDNSYTQEHGLTNKPDYIIALFQPSNSNQLYQIPITLSKNGNDLIGIEVIADDTNLYIHTGSVLLCTSNGDITAGQLSLYFYIRK